MRHAHKLSADEASLAFSPISVTLTSLPTCGSLCARGLLLQAFQAELLPCVYFERERKRESTAFVVVVLAVAIINKASIDVNYF